MGPKHLSATTVLAGILVLCSTVQGEHPAAVGVSHSLRARGRIWAVCIDIPAVGYLVVLSELDSFPFGSCSCVIRK